MYIFHINVRNNVRVFNTVMYSQEIQLNIYIENILSMFILHDYFDITIE